ncbi:MAG: hypothetical protein S0880_05640 [Actinomycetota bacterium]|nr:hypothetical protein [Actinomycetota bacterium]
MAGGTFDEARRRAHLAQLRTLLPGNASYDLEMLPFHATVEALGHAGEVDLGRVDVPLVDVVGSVARARDFDRALRPRNPVLRERWDAVARIEGDLPPVELIRLNDFYFVEDGHHRVSVARARGMGTIPAHVRRIMTIACANRALTVADLPAKAAERMFLERVPLGDDARIGFRLDHPDRWRELAEVAEAWGFRQHLAGHAVRDRCELADRWWAEEIVPLLVGLRARGVHVDDGADTPAFSARAVDLLAALRD